MKKTVLAFLTIAVFMFFNSCSDNSGGGTSTDPFGGGIGGGGTGGTGNVVFTIGHTQGQNGGILFTAKPSVDVTVTEFTMNLPEQNLSDKYQGDGTTVFKAGTVYSLEEYTGVATGQKWTFNFKGKIGSSTGTAYDVNSNYTIP